MDYKENINYRKSIEAKAFMSQRLSKEEKFWLKSNPMFNAKFDFPCYQKDVIDILKKSETIVKLEVIKHSDKNKVYRPVVSVIGKGKIKTSGTLLDINKKPVSDVILTISELLVSSNIKTNIRVSL